MFIDKKSPVPVYYQLKNLILNKIKNGEYEEGALIPSERELGETLNISRMTVRQALNQLVSEGVLYREKGRGTFVSKGKIEQRNIMSFSETVRKIGLTPSTRVLDFKKEAADEEIRGILGLSENESIYKIKRLRLADNMPIAIEEVFIPERYCPKLEEQDLKTSFYRLLRDEYSHIIIYIDNTTEASKPSAEERELLDIPSGTPILRVKGISHNEDDTRLFYSKDSYRSDKYSYNVRIYTNEKHI
jgi:GntR family transcriptional regulator